MNTRSIHEAIDHIVNSIKGSDKGIPQSVTISRSVNGNLKVSYRITHFIPAKDQE